jgi:hypothetical protein
MRLGASGLGQADGPVTAALSAEAPLEPAGAGSLSGFHDSA